MDVHLQIAVSGEQAQLLQEAARQESTDLTTWARAALLEAAREQVARRGQPGILGEAPTPSEEAFQALAEQWRRETVMLSSLTQKVQHPAYRKIIALGESALPWILGELRDRPGHWFEALRAITQQSPVAAHERANPQAAREAWLRWGRERGLIP